MGKKLKMTKRALSWLARNVFGIAVVVVLFFAMRYAIVYYDHGLGNPQSYSASLIAVVLGVLCSAVIGYLIWAIQQGVIRRRELNNLKANLINEIQTNQQRLVDLLEYLERLNKWATSLEDPSTEIKDLMICNDSSNGQHLKEILPYRQSSLSIDEAVAKGTIALLPNNVQDSVRQLAYHNREFNHRIDYSEKSSTDLIYVTIIIGVLKNVSPQGRKDLMSYQAKSIVRFLSSPAKDLASLNDRTLSLLDKAKAQRPQRSS